MSMASHLSVSRRIRGGSFSSDACSAPSHVPTISIFVPCIVLWPKEVAAVGARGVGVGTARKHASTQAHTAHTACASTPVPRKAPHPAHTATRMCQKTRTSPLAQGLAQCARRCAVSTVHTGTLCAAVTRERAYTATGQRQKHPGNQHPPACTSTANRHGCGGRACP